MALEYIQAEMPHHRGVEQLVARRAHNPEVVGSNPSPATKRNGWRRFTR